MWPFKTIRQLRALNGQNEQIIARQNDAIELLTKLVGVKDQHGEGAGRSGHLVA